MGAQDTRVTWRDGKPQIDHAMLEDQMCSYTGGPGEESPDVLDACVWAFTELIVNATKVGGMLTTNKNDDDDDKEEETDSDYVVEEIFAWP